MKFKLTKALIFACIITSAHLGFAQTFDRDRDFGRDSRRSGSTEEVTGVANGPRSNGVSQLGTNINVLSNIGANIEYSTFTPLSKPNENGQQSIFLGSSFSLAYGSQYFVDILSTSADLTLDYKIPIPNSDNLSIFFGAGPGYYYTSFLESGSSFGIKTPDAVSQFAFVFKGSVNYFFSNRVGFFGTLSKAGSGDLAISAGFAFRKSR
jgi:hypothetical protein